MGFFLETVIAGLMSGVLYALMQHDLKRLLAMSEKGVRWRDLKDNTAFPTGKSILINSTDVRKSNSAAMYLALAEKRVLRLNELADTIPRKEIEIAESDVASLRGREYVGLGMEADRRVGEDASLERTA